MSADKTSLELAFIEAYAHLEDSKPSPADGGTTFSRFSNGERNWTVPVTLVPLGGRGGGDARADLGVGRDGAGEPDDDERLSTEPSYTSHRMSCSI